jgi:hypothetical protein
MSNPISNIAYGIKWSIASVGCFAVYAATMIPYVWRTRNSGIGLREEKDRSSRKLTIVIEFSQQYLFTHLPCFSLPQTFHRGWKIRPPSLH